MAEVCIIRLNIFCSFVRYPLQVGSIMSESNSDSNPGSSDPNVDKSAIEFIFSWQDKQFSILAETLRKTLNALGQDLGTHLQKVLDVRLKENESVHDYTIPELAYNPPEDPDGNRREEEESLGPGDHEWNRPSASETDAPSKTEPEDPKGKRPVKRGRLAPLLRNRNQGMLRRKGIAQSMNMTLTL